MRDYRHMNWVNYEYIRMGLINFWKYVIDNGWQVAPMPEDEDGNFVCPFCYFTIPRKVNMDEVPEYGKTIYCPRCGEIEIEYEEG